jgi:hypothetical protein
MSVDRSDDFDVPSSSSPDGAGDRGGDGASDRRVQVEERDRFSYYDSLRVAVRDISEETPHAIAPDVSAETLRAIASPETWQAAAGRFRASWAEHCERWPDEEREEVDRSSDPEGSWRGESGRYLDSAANAEVEERCEQVAETERNVLTPAMREIEACDPDRQLVGFEHRLKGQDRLKDKVAATLEEQPGLAARDAACDVPDSVRYTFQYSHARYAEGVAADIARLKKHGFELIEELKNSWDDGQYKGINSRWHVADRDERFEVQFHTEVSFEAKQLTHSAYERVRGPLTSPGELRELRNFQREITAQIPVPPGAGDIISGFFRRA